MGSERARTQLHNSDIYPYLSHNLYRPSTPIHHWHMLARLKDIPSSDWPELAPLSFVDRGIFKLHGFASTDNVPLMSTSIMGP